MRVEIRRSIFTDICSVIHEITVSAYDKTSGTFEVVINREKGAGPNVATPDALKAASDMEGTTKAFAGRMQNNIGSIYVLYMRA